MDNAKMVLKAGSTVLELSDSMEIPLTSNMGFDEFFDLAVEKTKLEITNLHFRKVVKLIDFLEKGNEPLAKWERELLAALHKRKSVSLCG